MPRVASGISSGELSISGSLPAQAVGATIINGGICMSAKSKIDQGGELISLGGQPPAGWVYVASHSLATGYTKIGYSKWHPTKPCFRYPSGFKRLHHLEFSLRAFGLGELKKWSSEYHVDARSIECELRARLRAHQRRDVGTSREIFAISHSQAVACVRALIPGTGSGVEE
jgi:hypothetical protein